MTTTGEAAKLSNTATWVVVVTVLSIHVFGVVAAGVYSLDGTPGSMPTVLAYAASSVNALLVTLIGALLGIRAHFEGTFGSASAPQVTAAVLYVLSFLGLAALWAAAGDPVVPLVSDVVRSGIGIVIAALATVLGVKRVRARPTGPSRWLIRLAYVGVFSFFAITIYAAWYSLRAAGPGGFNDVWSWAATSLNGLLTANFGAIIGIRVVRAVAEQAGVSPSVRNGMGAIEKPQYVAAVVYVITMAVVLVVWGVERFTEDSSRIVPLIPEIGRAGLGVLLGAFAVALRVPGR